MGGTEGAMMVLICWGCQADAGVEYQLSIPSMEQEQERNCTAASRVQTCKFHEFDVAVERARFFESIVKSEVNSGEF